MKPIDPLTPATFAPYLGGQCVITNSSTLDSLRGRVESVDLATRQRQAVIQFADLEKSANGGPWMPVPADEQRYVFRRAGVDLVPRTDGLLELQVSGEDTTIVFHQPTPVAV